MTGDGELDPLSRRLFGAAVFLSVLLLLVLANSFLNGREGGPPGSRLELNPVASAADRVERCPGVRFSARVVYSSPMLPQPLTASGSGAADAKTERAYFTLDVVHPITGQPMQFVEIIDGDDEYSGGDTIAEVLPPGKEWVLTDADASEEDEVPVSMEESLELLDSSGEVALIGRETVRGVMTRRYSSEIEIGDLVDYLREQDRDSEADAYERIEGQPQTRIKAESWIDGKNLMRRMRFVMPSVSEPEEPVIRVDLRMDFFDYGPQPGIRIPEPHTVVEGPLEDAGEGEFVPGSVS